MRIQNSSSLHSKRRRIKVNVTERVRLFRNRAKNLPLKSSNGEPTIIENSTKYSVCIFSPRSPLKFLKWIPKNNFHSKCKTCSFQDLTFHVTLCNRNNTNGISNRNVQKTNFRRGSEARNNSDGKEIKGAPRNKRERERTKNARGPGFEKGPYRTIPSQRC